MISLRSGLLDPAVTAATGLHAVTDLETTL